MCTWDGEEYSLVGSTEWFEEYAPWLKNSAVSYLNIDVGVSGPRPGLSATPELHEIAVDTMKKIIFPFHGTRNMTLYDMWYETNDGEVGVLGSGSDYTSFLHNGIASVRKNSMSVRYALTSYSSMWAAITVPTTRCTTTTLTTTRITGCPLLAILASTLTSRWANIYPFLPTIWPATQ